MVAFRTRIICVAMLAFVFFACASALSQEELFDRLHRFDISCHVYDKKYQKKLFGLDNIAAYTELIAMKDKDKTLANVEAELEKSKAYSKTLDDLKKTAPAAGTKESAGIKALVNKAMKGDAGAVSALKKTGPAAIPAILSLRDAKAVLPTEELQALLSEFEADAEAAIASGRAGGLNADVVESMIVREKTYQDILKRAAVVLKGSKRSKPPWLPFVYIYGLGLIPFLLGIAGSVVYYGKLLPKVVIGMALSYLFYVCLHGFFQFFAPYI